MRHLGSSFGRTDSTMKSHFITLADLAIVAAIVLLTAIPRAKCQCVNSQWIRMGDRCYFWQSTAVDQATAVVQCAKLGSRLPTLKSTNEVTNYKAFMALNNSVFDPKDQWMGFMQSNGSFVTFDDGTPFNSALWGAQQPDGTGACGSWYRGSAGMDDSWCGWTFTYACEQGFVGQTSIQCAPLQRYKFNSPALYLTTTYLITDNVQGNSYLVESAFNTVSAATIQVPGVTQPLYQVTYGSFQIMATDAELSILTQKSGVVNRILAYVISPSQGPMMANAIEARLLWNMQDPTNSVLSIDSTETGNFLASSWILKSTVYLFVTEPNAPKFSATCALIQKTTTATTTTITTTSTSTAMTSTKSTAGAASTSFASETTLATSSIRSTDSATSVTTPVTPVTAAVTTPVTTPVTMSSIEASSLETRTTVTSATSSKSLAFTTSNASYATADEGDKANTTTSASDTTSLGSFKSLSPTASTENISPVSLSGVHTTSASLASIATTKATLLIASKSSAIATLFATESKLTSAESAISTEFKSPTTFSMATASVTNLATSITNTEMTVAPTIEDASSPEPWPDDLALTTLITADLPFVQSFDQLPGSLFFNLDEYLIACWYNGQKCDMTKDWLTYRDPVYGNCFTFNFDGRRVRGRRGLDLVLQNQEGEYLCSSESAGFKVQVHDPSEYPMMTAYGQNVVSGYALALGISRLILNKINQPMGHCVDTHNGQSFYPGTYTTEACIRTCYQRYAIQRCGCADPRYLKPTEANYCTLNNKSCTDRMESCETDFVTLLNCNCPDKCQSVIYNFVTSMASLDQDPVRNSFSRLNVQKRNVSLIHLDYVNGRKSSEYTEELIYDAWALVNDVFNQFQSVLGLEVAIVLELAIFLATILHGTR